jgi:type I restriction enzyme, R subunit
VLDQRIQSMTEFKQIIGRGTRINEDYDKYWFTIMDFKKATELFADPAFDGDPVQVYEPKGDESPVPPDEPEPTDQDGNKQPPSPPDLPDGGDSQPRIKYVIADVPVYVVAERVQFYGPDGKLTTESLRDYTRSCVRKQYASMHDFLRRWSSVDQKKIIVEELAAQGVLWEPLAKEVENKLGKALDAFDLICHVAFDQPPLSRRERAENVKKRNYFAKYGEQARQVLEALLEKYADTGIENIEDIKVLTIHPLSRLGTAPELVGAFGGKLQYLQALHELEEQLYQ